MSGYETLPIELDARVVERESGAHKQSRVLQYLLVQFTVLDRRRKAMEIRDKHVDLELVSSRLRHVNHGEHCTKVITYMQVIIRP